VGAGAGDARPEPYSAIQGLIAPGNPPGRHHYWKAGLLGELSDEAIETFVALASDPSRSAVEAGFGPEEYARLVEIKRATTRRTLSEQHEHPAGRLVRRGGA
jgi:hypothetical protein